MGFQIQDGRGTGNLTKVTSRGRLQTSSIQESIFEHGVEQGNGFNINTQFINLTTANESALLYFKNNEDTPVIIDNMIISTASGTSANLGIVRIWTNPSQGTIITSAQTIESVNRLVGSSKEFDFTTYKGFEGATYTSVSTTPLLYVSTGNTSRSAISTYIGIEKGQSVVVTYEPRGQQPTSVYIAFAGFILDTENT